MNDKLQNASAIHFPDDGPCPCASGKTVAKCRCKARRFVPEPVVVRAGRILTGMRLEKCYANWLGKCLPPLSSEHAISKSISVDFGGEPTVRVLRDGSRRIVPPSSGGRRVLCKRHNSALSALDEIGRRFIRANTECVRHVLENRSEDTHSLLNGYDVERWMLKILCAMAHDEPISRIDPSPIWRVPESWARVLFEGRPKPDGAGIYVPRIARGRFDRGILTAKITGRSQNPGPTRSDTLDSAESLKVAGISVCIYGQDFDMFMSRPADASDFWYRPRMFRQRSAAGGVAHIHLGWDDAAPTFKGNVLAVDRENVADKLLRG
jgi:hypothetical protein